GVDQPTASNVNFTGGQTIANLATVKLGSDGRIRVTNNSPGSVHLLADIAGYYVAGDDVAGAPEAAGGFVSVSPSRILDTRTGNGALRAAVAGFGSVDVQVTGRAGVPVSGVTAVVVNVTVAGASTGGFLTVYPSGVDQPTASNVNFTGGQTIANLATVKLGSDGRIRVTNNSPGSVHLLADIAGYYVAG
ncbi:hypothetical protein, partial [Microbacterium sp.]|uniref:hypothetical protein n=1 Tax=Microbacterium sp. TaxID=51671 RepID=UPI0037C8EC65